MYISITQFVIECAANSLIDLKVRKLLGTRRKKLKSPFFFMIFLIRIKSYEDGEWPLGPAIAGMHGDSRGGADQAP